MKKYYKKRETKNCIKEKKFLRDLFNSSSNLYDKYRKLQNYIDNNKPCSNSSTRSSSNSLCGGTCGDLNQDNAIDVIDVVSMVSLVLDNQYNPCGDMNGDGEVNVLDIVNVVGYILGENELGTCIDPTTQCDDPNDCYSCCPYHNGDEENCNNQTCEGQSCQWNSSNNNCDNPWRS